MSIMSSWEFFTRNFEIREKLMETLFTFALVYFFIWFANFYLAVVELSDEKIELLINFSSQSIFMFGVKLSDNYNRMKRAASQSSAIINFDAINWRQFFCAWHQNLVSNLWRQFLVCVSEALGAVRDEDELIRFRGQRSRSRSRRD